MCNISGSDANNGPHILMHTQSVGTTTQDAGYSCVEGSVRMGREKLESGGLL